MATPKAPAKPAKGPRRESEDELQQKYPNLAAEKAWDKEQHIKRGIASGLTRKEATRHANEDVSEGED